MSIVRFVRIIRRFFWVNEYCRIYIQRENQKYTWAKFRFEEVYDHAYDEVDTVFRGIEQAVSEIEAARASDSRYDTVKAIHDYICHTTDYDTEAYDEMHATEEGGVLPAITSRLASPAFGGRGAYRFVCAGYAKAFQLLCHRMDIPCVKVSGDTPVEYHAWNEVQMEDGQWYGMDVTWDDFDERSVHPLIYTHFLCGSRTETLNRFMILRKDQTDFSFAGFHQPDPSLIYIIDDKDAEVQWKILWYPPLTEEAYPLADLLRAAYEAEYPIAREGDELASDARRRG